MIDLEAFLDKEQKEFYWSILCNLMAMLKAMEYLESELEEDLCRTGLDNLKELAGDFRGLYGKLEKAQFEIAGALVNKDDVIKALKE